MSLIRRYSTARAAAEACGDEILRLLAGKPQATLAISGGASPKLMFEHLARAPFDWSRVHIFWVDERCVPRDDPRSNFKLAHDAWLRHVPAQVHPVLTDLVPEAAARNYAREIEPFLPLDVIHRGMGADAHTASLFPGDPLINDLTSLAGVAQRETPRVTLMRAVLESARQTVILATGPDKAEPLLDVLSKPRDPVRYPAQINSIDPATVTWFIDEAAAARLP